MKTAGEGTSTNTVGFGGDNNLENKSKETLKFDSEGWYWETNDSKHYLNNDELSEMDLQ